MNSLLATLENITNRDNRNYHLWQMAIFGSVSLISSIFFTGTPPLSRLSLNVTAYVISQLSTPLFVQLFEPYRSVSLGPLAGQAANISFAYVTANIICALFHLSVSYKSLPKEILIFLSIFAVARFAIYRLSS